MNIIPTTTSF